MAVLFPGKFLYLAHTRVGSRATVAMLKAAGGEEVDTGLSGGGRGHHAHFWNVVRHSDYRGEMVVCTVRNHFEALVTWWMSFNRKGNNCNQYSFGEFLTELVARDECFMTQMKNGQTWWFHRHARWSDHILRHETLQHDLNILMQFHGLPPRDLPRNVNVTPDRPPTRSFYTPFLRAKVEQMFRDEMKHYGYSWENINA